MRTAAAAAAALESGEFRLSIVRRGGGGEASPGGTIAPLQPAPDVEQLPLFEMGVDMAKLKAVRGALLARPGAASSARAYEADWADFADFCKRAGRGSLPATSDTLELYLVDAAARGQSINTLKRRVTGVRVVHRTSKLAAPSTGGALKLLQELARDGHGKAEPKRALSVDELEALIRRCEDDPRSLRDKAVLLLGFASGMRRSELVGLDLADVRVVRDGLEVFVRRGKTDQRGQGRTVPIWPAKRPHLCPVKALRAWVAARGKFDGPLFVGWRGQVMLRKRLDSAAVGDIVQRRAAEAGLKAEQYGGHSLRAGCVTAAIKAGASLPTVMLRTGHTSVATLQRYFRPASAWAAGNPLDKAL